MERRCAPYADREDVWGWCLREAVSARQDPAVDDPAVDDPAVAVAVCARAGRWEEACRLAWVAARLGDESVGTDVLLGVCGDAADCAFRVLDARPAGDLAVEVERCRALAGRHAVDCARHALQRWVAAGTDASAVQRACAVDFPDVEDAGRWLAWPVACQGVGRCCASPSPLAAACGRARDLLRADPSRCRTGPLAAGAGPASSPR